MNVITYPCWHLSYSIFVKGVLGGLGPGIWNSFDGFILVYWSSSELRCNDIIIRTASYTNGVYSPNLSKPLSKFHGGLAKRVFNSLVKVAIFVAGSFASHSRWSWRKCRLGWSTWVLIVTEIFIWILASPVNWSILVMLTHWPREDVAFKSIRFKFILQKRSLMFVVKLLSGNTS